MKNNKYIFATDVDGTMLMDNKEVNNFTLQAFKEAQSKGHINVIATGRCVKKTLPLLEKNPFIDYFVCNNGAVIYDVKKEKTILVFGVNPQHYPIIVDFARKNNAIFKLHTDKDWIGDEWDGDERPTILTPEMDLKIREHIRKYPNDECLYNGQIPTQLSINSSAEFCKKNISKLRELFENDSSVCLTNSIYIDINCKNKSKWTGLLEIAKLNSINKKNIVTFGDSGNDIEMILNAKELGFALANSTADLLEKVESKIGDNNSDAIGKVIIKLIN